MSPDFAVQWKKSSRSQLSQECVEYSHLGSTVALRDSRSPSRGTIVISDSAWRIFLDAVRAGEFDVPIDHC